MKSGLRLEKTAQEGAGLALLDIEPSAFAFGLWKNIVIAAWTASADAERAARFAGAASKAAERLPGQLRSNVHIIVQSAGLPDNAARAAFSALLSAKAQHLACFAIVVQGTGFWSGAIRGAMTQMRVQANVPVTHRIFGSIEEVSRWLPGEHARRSGVTVSPDDLRSALQGVLAAAT